MTPLGGLILAGGRGRRLGGIDKALIPAAGRALIVRVFERLRPQVGPVAISANGDPGRFAFLGCRVLPDSIPDFAGPLAGILAGLDWARAQGLAGLVCVATDTPLFPADLAARLVAGRGASSLAVATSGGRRHPTFALWPTALAERLRHAVAEQGERRLDGLAQAWGAAVVDWPAKPFDPFHNVNTQQDLTELERLIRDAEIG